MGKRIVEQFREISKYYFTIPLFGNKKRLVLSYLIDGQSKILSNCMRSPKREKE